MKLILEFNKIKDESLTIKYCLKFQEKDKKEYRSFLLEK